VNVAGLGQEFPRALPVLQGKREGLPPRVSGERFPGLPGTLPLPVGGALWCSGCPTPEPPGTPRSEFRGPQEVRKIRGKHTTLIGCPD
jgi:hypothetical protein